MNGHGSVWYLPMTRLFTHLAQLISDKTVQCNQRDHLILSYLETCFFKNKDLWQVPCTILFSEEKLLYTFIVTTRELRASIALQRHRLGLDRYVNLVALTKKFKNSFVVAFFLFPSFSHFFLSKVVVANTMLRRKSSSVSVYSNYQSTTTTATTTSPTAEFASKFNKVNGKAMIDALKESRKVNR